MKNHRLAVISLVARCAIGFFGLLQVRSALPIFGITGLAQIASAATFLSAGILLESGLAWNLRVRISQVSGQEILVLVHQAFRRLIYFCLPISLLCFVSLVWVQSSSVRLIFTILFLTLINLLFLPWLRLLEGIGQQHITIIIQILTSFLVLIFTLLNVSSMNILQFALVANSGTLLTSIMVYVFCKFKFKRFVPNGASYLEGTSNIAILHRDSLIVVLSGTLMFCFFPTIYHWNNGDIFVAQSGIQLRIFSLMIGVIGVVGTQLQIMGRTRVETNKYLLKIQIFMSPLLILSFVLSDNLLQYFVLGKGNDFNLIESLAYGVLASLVASQIQSSADELRKFGLRLQARSYAICAFFFLIGCGMVQVFNFSLVWYTCVIYYFLHIQPLRKRIARS